MRTSSAGRPVGTRFATGQPATPRTGATARRSLTSSSRRPPRSDTTGISPESGSPASAEGFSMTRWLALTTLLALAVAPLTADDPKKSTEQELLAQLTKLAAPPARREVRGLDADELRAFQTNRAKAALKLVGEFEARFPRSPALAQARSEALTAVEGVDGEEVAAAAAKVAKALLDDSPKGSDLAGHADLFLRGQRFRKAFRDATSVDDFRAAWKKRTGTIRKEAEEFM